VDQREVVLGVCGGQPGAVLSYPFGNGVAVFKLAGKMFALVSLSGTPGAVSVKVEPELGRTLVASHRAINPGYHLNKAHWVTVTLDGSVGLPMVTGLIEDSHELVLAGLPRAVRATLPGRSS
jgi:predicted DNA-binding protein (MmcQ/YjbR family)